MGLRLSVSASLSVPYNRSFISRLGRYTDLEDTARYQQTLESTLSFHLRLQGFELPFESSFNHITRGSDSVLVITHSLIRARRGDNWSVFVGCHDLLECAPGGF